MGDFRRPYRAWACFRLSSQGFALGYIPPALWAEETAGGGAATTVMHTSERTILTKIQHKYRLSVREKVLSTDGKQGAPWFSPAARVPGTTISEAQSWGNPA